MQSADVNTNATLPLFGQGSRKVIRAIQYIPSVVLNMSKFVS